MNNILHLSTPPVILLGDGVVLCMIPR